MSLSDEISRDQTRLGVKILHLFNSLYPTVDWDVFKTQVLEGRRIFNPHKRYGQLWFHIPSMINCLRELDFETYRYVTKDSPFWRTLLTTKVVCIDHKKTISIRGINELKFRQLGLELSQVEEAKAD